MLCWFLLYILLDICAANSQNEATSIKQTAEDNDKNDYEDVSYSQEGLSDYNVDMEGIQVNRGDSIDEEDADDIKVIKRKGPFSFYPRWMYEQFKQNNDDPSEAKRVGAFSLMPKFIYRQLKSKDDQHEAKRVSSFHDLPKWMYKQFSAKDDRFHAMKRMGFLFHLPKFLSSQSKPGENKRISSLSLFPNFMYKQLGADELAPMTKKLASLPLGASQLAPMTKKLSSLPPWLNDDVPQEKKDPVLAASRSSMVPRWMNNQFSGSTTSPSPRRSALYQPAWIFVNKATENNALVHKQKKNEKTPRWQLMQSNKISKKDLLKLIMMLKYVGKRDRPTRYLDIV